MPGTAADQPLASTHTRARTVALGIASALPLILYPVIVYFAFDTLGIRGASLLMVVALAPTAAMRLRALASQRLGTLAFVPLVALVLVSLAAVLETASLVLAVPTAVNLVLLAAFAPTLVQGPPMIERFARLTDPELREEEVAWCRAWTRIWCAFFFLNALAAALLAAFAPLAWWVFHTSILGYVSMGVLLGTEWIIRKLRFRRFGNSPLDRFVARFAVKEGA